MSASDYRTLRELFEAASERTGDARRAFLDEHCADPELRRKVERLLAADERADAFLETPPPDPTADAGRARDLPLPERIGRYRVLRRLGEGGMGAVYAAEQDHPRRTVALKVLHAGLTTPAMLRRFEFESEVLAQLRHVGIAAIHEAGTAEIAGTTVPFFAMELVEGVPITKHADERGLDLRARLELVSRVADAVEHAHQKGIIHRDLKPQNVLVDASGQPKILDFGIARAADADGRSASLVTQSGMLVGTLAYMSPEQANGETRALDTRSDVYALGVMAYELVTGTLPYDVGDLPITSAARVVAEEEPRRPSTIVRRLRGDVETILLKALEKDKERRYASAAEFAADVRAHLADEPIRARPATTAYQLAKFARRHRGLVAGLAATFVALVVGLVVSISFYWKSEASLVKANEATAAETRERERAQRAATAEASERQRAERAAKRAESTNRFFVVEMMSAPDPWASSGKDVTVASILDRIETRITHSFADEPELEGDAQVTIAKSFLARGLATKARDHARRALELRLALHPGDHPDVADARLALARAQWELGDLADSETNARLALETYDRLPETDPDVRVEAVRQLARTRLTKGDHAAALAGFEELLEDSVRRFGEDSGPTAQVVSGLVSVHVAMGNTPEAERLARRVLSTRRRLHASDDPYLAIASNDLSSILYEKNDDADRAEVESLTAEAARILEARLGAEHRLTLLTRRNHANAVMRLGRVEEAAEELREVLAVLPRVVGEGHEDHLQTLNSHAYALFTLGRLDEAEVDYRRAIELSEKALGPGHADTLRPLSNLAYLEKQRGLKSAKKGPDGVIVVEPDSDLARALEHFRRVHEGFLALYGTDHKLLAAMRYGYADLLDLVGRRREAADLFGAHYRNLLHNAPEDYESTVTQVLFRQGTALVKCGALAEAEPVLRDAVNRSRAVFPDKDWRAAMSIGALGECLALRGTYDEAEALLLEAHAAFAPLSEKRAADLARAKQRLAALYDAWGKPDRAAAFRDGS